MSEARQWQGKTSGGTFGQKSLFFILKHIKAKTLYPILYLIIPFCLIFARKTNNAIYHYFHRVLGYGKWDAFRANVRNAFTFGRVVIDKFALLAGRSEQFEVDVRNPEVFNNLLQQDKGFILAGSHIGNFELLGHCMKQDRKAINGIIFGGETKVMQEKRTETFGENNVKLIPVLPDMSHLFAIKNALDNGEIVTILCDRIFGSPKKKTVDFLGHPADFPIGTFRMAAQLEVPMVSVFIMKEKGSRYTGYLVPLQLPESATTVTEKVESLLSQYVQSIENILRKYPEQWFNYYEFWNNE